VSSTDSAFERTPQTTSPRQQPKTEFRSGEARPAGVLEGETGVPPGSQVVLRSGTKEESAVWGRGIALWVVDE